MDMNLILLAICTYGAILVFGSILHKYLRMPWMFTVVILGIILSTFGLFRDSMQGNTFLFLSKTGMLFFLFTIGIDLDLEKIRQLVNISLPVFFQAHWPVLRTPDRPRDHQNQM